MLNITLAQFLAEINKIEHPKPGLRPSQVRNGEAQLIHTEHIGDAVLKVYNNGMYTYTESGYSTACNARKIRYLPHVTEEEMMAMPCIVVMYDYGCRRWEKNAERREKQMLEKFEAGKREKMKSKYIPEKALRPTMPHK